MNHTSPSRLSGAGVEPQPDPVQENRFSARALQELEEICTHYPERKAACLPALWIAQREYGGCLTPAAIQEVATLLGLSLSQVEGVAAFYTMYNLRPRGRHHLEVCTCLTCAVLGAFDVVHALEHSLGIGLGETTPDGEFTLSETECLNHCGAAVVAQVGDKYFTHLTPNGVTDLIELLKGTDQYTPEKLADSIVKLQTPGASELGGGSYNSDQLTHSAREAN